MYDPKALNSMIYKKWPQAIAVVVMVVDSKMRPSTFSLITILVLMILLFADAQDEGGIELGGPRRRPRPPPAIRPTRRPVNRTRRPQISRTTPKAAATTERPEIDPEPPQNGKLRRCGNKLAVDLNRIYGGQDATPGEFPHQASLQIRYLDSHICGATLITEQWVLCAAHCFSRSRFPFNFNIVLGEHNLRKKEPEERKLKVQKIIVHEKYDKNKQLYDIALLKLEKPMDFENSEKHLKPVCLADNTVEIKNQHQCVATGWGRGDKGRIRTDILQKLVQPVHNSTRCNEIWKGLGWPITERHICIGDLKYGKGVCNGDSGGPIQCRLQNGDWLQVGIASWTINDCIAKGYAAVFTKVASYRGWIEEQIARN